MMTQAHHTVRTDRMAKPILAGACSRCAFRTRTLAALAIAVCGVLHAQTPVAAPRPVTLPPIKARLLIREGDKDATINREVVLLGHTAQTLLAQAARGDSASFQVDKARVLRCEFALDYDHAALSAAVRDYDWAAAVRTLAPSLRVALPYLDLADNNGLDLAMDLGTYMILSADRERRAASDAATRERAMKQYEAAYDVFRDAGRADWSPLAPVAILKGCRALLSQGKDEAAATNLKRVENPDPGDPAYGHYWLVQAELFRRAGKTREAIDAIVNSIVFADKDAETFPSALLLSADCYTALGEHHRARDVYYEVAVLFTGTDWAADARIGLQAIMDGKKTLEPEKTPIENVFFNMTEDMNKLADELLKTPAEPKTTVGAPKAVASGNF
ncbi:MAG: hypothetical protein FJ222_00250 [Lentisphaerae bacterium]|nr:hypothetical protein [Lentisphaerota bacterium]